MFDRRKLDRKFLTYFARVTDRKTDRLLGYLVDLTTGGALLIGDVPLKIGVDFSLRVDLPEELTDKKFLDIEARAVWNQPDVDPEFYRTGLQLLQTTPEELSILGRVLSHYSAKR
jgi:c-di-GMP-binding flagellar brake protein YcgR